MRKDYKKASETIGNTATMFMGIAIILMIILLAAVRPIVSVMSTPVEAVEGTIRYLTICFIGIPFISAYNIISAIFRGIGDSKSPMYFIAVACAANIGLDYLFIGVMGLDAAGAALGTTIAQAVSVIVSLTVIIKKGTGIKLRRSDLRPKRHTMKNILKVGVPVALQETGRILHRYFYRNQTIFVEGCRFECMRAAVGISITGTQPGNIFRCRQRYRHFVPVVTYRASPDIAERVLYRFRIRIVGNEV